jgi:hypothetical protein
MLYQIARENIHHAISIEIDWFHVSNLRAVTGRERLAYRQWRQWKRNG